MFVATVEDDEQAEATVMQWADGEVLSTGLSLFSESDPAHALPIARGDLYRLSLSSYDYSGKSILKQVLMSIRASSSVSTFEVTPTSSSSSESEQSNSSVDLCMSFRGSRCTSALIDMIRTFVEFTNDNIHTVFLAFFHDMEFIF